MTIRILGIRNDVITVRPELTKHTEIIRRYLEFNIIARVGKLSLESADLILRIRILFDYDTSILMVLFPLSFFAGRHYECGRDRDRH